MHIPEYLEDCELVAAEDLAREPAFWLAHLMLTVGDPSEDPERYGVDASVYEEMVERLRNPEEPWPVLRVPLEGGHTAYAVYANFDDANNVDFFVRQPQWGRLGYLGQYGADEAGPGLSWTELATLAEAAQDSSEGLTDSSQRLLLLLPMLGDAVATYFPTQPTSWPPYWSASRKPIANRFAPAPQAGFEPATPALGFGHGPSGGASPQ
ncbi:hypothetical protein [Streptomyces collinus]|uniref:hypothetical protein n=1 Tax=Streptomyces collinus TaxID=42684 RepID=UPI0036E724E1